ncbi:GNAT family N-acetyltransferase [Desulfatibacillum aliphaticivorans]|nr:GNAT family N-acetyltransferase [Desulfatibacillum aliphaticivorans]
MKNKWKGAPMDYEIKRNCDNVDWQAVSDLLKTVGMAHYPPDIHQKAFEASYSVVFILDSGKLVGMGRAISDGAYQAAFYDFAVSPDYQGAGLGRIILSTILADVPNCHVILYAAIGKEGYYETQGFRKMKTGMARFLNAEAMAKKGFTE